MKKVSLFLLSIILLISFLLGSRMILSGDFFYLYDQARDYLLVKNVVDAHSFILIGNRSGLGGFFHGPLWIYLLTPVYILSSGNPFGLAYFYIGLQLITILAAYLIGSKLYGYKGGILVSLLIALSPVTWATVSNTVSANIEPLVYLALFYFLIKFWRGSSKSFIFAAFFTGLSLQFETSSALVLIPSVITIYFLNNTALKNSKVLGLSLISFILSISTFILFDLRHKFLMTNSLIHTITGGQKGMGYLELHDRFISHFNSLQGVYKSMLFNQSILLIFILTVIFIFGTILIIKSKNKHRKEFIFCLIFPTLMFGFFMFYPYTVWPEYVFGLLVPVTLAFYLAIIAIWKNALGKVLVILFFALTFFNVFIYIQNQYFQSYLQNNSAGSYINQKAVVEWIYRDGGKGKFGYFVYTPEIFTHGMDYLISFTGKSFPNTIMESKKDKITYLILYPHLANDQGAYDFWKKNTLKTNGKVILTKTFNGGIIVEKLLIDANEPAVDPNYYQGLIFR